MTMKYFRFDWKTLGFALALAVASFALNGCALLKELRKGGDECLEEICYGEGEVGPEGGIVEFDGMRLEIPEGALEEYVYITIDALGFDPLPGMTKHSPVYNFNPAGQQFLKPVTVIIEADSPADGLAVLWSLPGSTDEFEALSTKRDGASFTAETTHFSFAFLGFPDDLDRQPTGEGSCGEGDSEHLEGANGTWTVGALLEAFSGMAERYLGKGSYFAGVGSLLPARRDGEIAAELISSGEPAGMMAAFCSADGQRAATLHYQPKDGFIIECGAEHECDIAEGHRLRLSELHPKLALEAAYADAGTYGDSLFYALLTPHIQFPGMETDHSLYEWKFVALEENVAMIANAITRAVRDPTPDETDYFGLDYSDDD